MKYLPLLLLAALVILLALAGCVSSTAPETDPLPLNVRLCNIDRCFDTVIVVGP